MNFNYIGITYQFWNLVRESINEMEKINNVKLLISEHNPKISNEERLAIYEERTKWNDFRIGVPVLFNYYHGLELLMKGLLQEVNAVPRNKNHKLTEYYAQIIINEDKFTLEIINTIGQFLKKANLFEKFFTDNGGSVDDFYIMLRYPGPIKENIHFGFQHINGTGEKGLEKWLRLRDNTVEIKKGIENWIKTLPKTV
jgi:hypothetical protein